MISLIQLRASIIDGLGRTYPEYKTKAKKNMPPIASAEAGLEHDTATARKKAFMTISTVNKIKKKVLIWLFRRRQGIEDGDLQKLSG